jgi:hypothetical protein
MSASSKQLTAQQAVLRGQLIISLPVCVIIVSGCLLSSLLPRLIAILCVVLSIAAAWLWWSLLFRSGETGSQHSNAPLEETLTLAVQRGLIWSKDSFFEKTEKSLRQKRRPFE